MDRRSLLKSAVFVGIVAKIGGSNTAATDVSEPTAPRQPVQTPIRGEEDLGDLAQPEQALAQFYKAFSERNLAMMQENWDNSDDAVLDNPLGGIRRGWPEIRKMYERIFGSTAKVSVKFYDYTLVKEGNVFWAAGRERGSFTKDTLTLPLAIRTSRVFRRQEGRWRQVHHHGSIEDPQLLAAYQAAVR